MASWAGASIGGVVRSGDGTPLANAVVTLGRKAPAHRDIAAVTDDAGTYIFRSLASGSYWVYVRADGYVPQRKTVVAATGPSRPVDFAMRR
jgi:hypothetical protein